MSHKHGVDSARLICYMYIYQNIQSTIKTEKPRLCW